MTNAEIIQAIKAEIERRIALYSSLSENTVNPNRIDEDRQILSFLSTLESEKPIDGLEEEIERWDRDNADDNGFYNRIDFARHFYDLGCRRTAEKYDEIEYNRQRAEESEKPMNLEEEINRYLREECSDDDEPGIHEIAEHFAKWGAEHLASTGKTSPKDLEEAADNHIRKVVDAAGHPGWDWTTQDIADAFIAGAKLQKEHDAELIEIAYNDGITIGMIKQKEQMMKDAVEGKVFMSFDPSHNQMVMADVDLPTNTKVRVIVLPKED